MKNDELFKKVFDLSEKFNKTSIETRTAFVEALGKIEKALSINNEILEQINDQNRLHSETLKENTLILKQQITFFNKLWFVFLVLVIVFISIVVKEKFSDVFKLFF